MPIALEGSYGSDHMISYWHGMDSNLIANIAIILRFIIDKLFDNYKEPEYLLEYFDVLLSIQPHDELNFRLLDEAERILLSDFANADWIKERVRGLYLKYKPDYPKAVSDKKSSRSISATDFVKLVFLASDYSSKKIESAMKICGTNDLIKKITQLTKNEDYDLEFVCTLESLSRKILRSGDERAIVYLLNLSLTNNSQEWKHNTKINSLIFQITEKYPFVVAPILKKYFDDESFREIAMSQTCYAELLFRCAKNMRYPDFYQIWCGLSN